MQLDRMSDRQRRRLLWRFAMNCLLVTLIAASSSVALGDPRALLVGVSYRDSRSVSTLQGIDLDVDRMEQFARDLGIVNIRRLEDGEATLRGIRAAMRELADGVGPEDLTLIYFSGHGTRVPDRGEMDEDDGFDESLLPTDARPVMGPVLNARGEPVLDAQGEPRQEIVDVANGLVDDEFYQMLGWIRSDRVLVVIDACNSGTSAKSVGMTPKFYFRVAARTGPGSNSPGGSRSFVPAQSGATAKFIGIMAAQDHEYALATNDGSVLTNALHRSLSAVKNAGAAQVTVGELFERVNQDVAMEMKQRYNNHPQHPNLFVPPGSESLRGLLLPLGRGAEDGASLNPPEDDPLINQWMAYADRAGRRVELSVPRQAFTLHPNPSDASRVCDPRYSAHLLSVEVEAPEDGYLNVLNAGQGEQAPIVLFPNGYSMEDNRVRKGERIVIPPPGVDWCLPASSIPPGLDTQWVLVVAAFSTAPMNFHRDGIGGGPIRTAPDDAYRSFTAMGAGPRIEAAATAQVLIRRR